jgi:cellulose biosynthesis protein BcsQ
MLTYTVIGEGGGIGKTTNAGNCAVAHHRRGRKVLAIDLAEQTGSLTNLLNAEEPGPDEDNLVRHMIGRELRDFEDIVTTSSEGIDVIPSHQSLEKLPEHLRRAGEMAKEFGDDWNPHTRLFEVLKQGGVRDKYDVVLVDVPGNGEKYHTNALYATRNVLVPVELSSKGQSAINDLRETTTAMQQKLDIDIGVLAMVPFEYKGTNAQKKKLEELHESEFDVPVVFRERTSLASRFWEANRSVYGYLADGGRLQSHETDYPLKVDRLVAHIEEQSDLPPADQPAWEED